MYKTDRKIMGNMWAVVWNESVLKEAKIAVFLLMLLQSVLRWDDGMSTLSGQLSK